MPEQIDNRLSDLRVLLIDDDEACRTFLALGLEMEGIKVVQAGSAEDAMEALKDSYFDCIATDVNLPAADGFALLRHVREHVGDVPVILITGFSSVRSAVDALKLGAQDYLPKPIESVDIFLGTVIKAVEHHRVTMQNKALQERLDRAEKMESLANIAGGVAHDLNNIISPMVSLPDIMIDEVTEIGEQSGCDVAELIEDISLMKASGIRAASVVRDLMTSSRRLNFEARPLNLNSLVKSCVDAQEVKEVMSDCPGLELKLDFADDDCIILGSEPHVERAVYNLIRNAVEAMDESITGHKPSGKIIRVETSLISINRPVIAYDVIEEGDYARVRVVDGGVGVDKKIATRVIEPFFSTKKETGRSGSGLGLAVVHGIMKDHHGFVDISNTDGEGAIFDLYFPLSKDAVPSAVVDADACGGSERILVVDDEPAQRIVASRMLRKLGYNVQVVNNGHEALKLIRKEREKVKTGEMPFDLVILDMIMEEEFDGFTTLTKIRESCPAMRAVIASGFAPTGRVQSAVEIGAGWLAKPYNISSLARVLREKLDK